MIKTVRKLALEKNFLNRIKDVYEKLTATITFKGERLKAFTFECDGSCEF